MKKEKKVAIKIFSSRNEKKKHTHTHKKVTTGSATLRN